MELLQLRYFCDAAKTQNFSLTAKKYFVPPSNISQTIKRLERELGVKLFNRNANKISLNSDGKRFYEKVSRAISILDTARLELTNEKSAKKLRISVNSNRRIVMAAIERFRIKHPDVDIITLYSYSDGDDYDVVVIPDFIPDEYESWELISEKISLAVNSESKLAEFEKITANDLKDEKFVSMNEGSNLYHHTKRVGDALGFTPHIAIQTDDPFYVRKCIEMGLAVAFIPSFSWDGLIPNNVVLLDVGDFLRKTYVCKRKESSNIYADEIISILLDIARQS